jgi:molybdopterin molybdotransferase
MHRRLTDLTLLGTERGAQPNGRASRPRGGLTTSWPEARALAGDGAKPLPWVEIDIAHACGRTLACELRALAPLPAFDSAAMDGWAVRGPGPWRVIGHLLAGNESPGALEHGSAIEIATGTWVPFGADGVLPYEAGLLLGSELAGDNPVGLNIRRTAEECAAGTVVLPTGTLLAPAALGLAAAIGHDRLVVRTRPRVIALVTGDELLCRGLPGSGRIRDAIGPILAGAVESFGGQLVGLEHPGDDAELLCRQIDGADADVVVTTGASSVGPAGHLPALLQRLGAQVLIDGVAVKPGHSQSFARLLDGRLLVGLPGNPLAAMVGLVTLVQPVLSGLAGAGLQSPSRARLAGTIAAAQGAHRLVPVRRSGDSACPTGHGGAAMLRGAAVADAFAVISPGADAAYGDEIEILALP